MTWFRLGAHRVGPAVAIAAAIAVGAVVTSAARLGVSVTPVPPLAGCVRTPTGAPAADVLVGLRVRPMEELASLDRFVATFLTPKFSWGRQYAGVFTRTDPRGCFRLSLEDTLWRVPRGEITDSVRDVMVMAEGYHVLFRRLRETDTVTTLTLVRAPWDTLAWRLVGPNKTPVANARVRIMAGDEVWRTMRSDPAGRVRLVVPAHHDGRVLIDAAGFRTTEVTLSASGESVRTATMPLQRVLTGTVRDARSRPVTHREVSVGEWAFETDARGMFVDTVPLKLSRTGAAGRMEPSYSVRTEDDGEEGIAYRLSHLTEPHPRVTIVTAPRAAVHLALRPPADWANDTLHATFMRLDPSDSRGPRLDYGVYLSLTRGANDDSASLQGATAMLPGRYVAYVSDQLFTPIIKDSVAFTVPAGVARVDLPVAAVRYDATNTDRLLLNHPAPQIDAVTLDGVPVTLSSLKGKVVVLDFWAYWCPPCIRRIVELAALRDSLVGKPVEIIALHDASVRTRAEYENVFQHIVASRVNEQPLPFPVWLDQPVPEQVNVPFDDRDHGLGRTSQAFGIRLWPTTYLIDAQGCLVRKVVSDAELSRAIADVLAAPAKPCS